MVFSNCNQGSCGNKQCREKKKFECEKKCAGNVPCWNNQSKQCVARIGATCADQNTLDCTAGWIFLSKNVSFFYSMSSNDRKSNLLA